MIDKEKIRQKESQLLNDCYTEIITKVNDIDRLAYFKYSQQTASCLRVSPDYASRELCLQNAEKELKAASDPNYEFLDFVEVE